MYIIHETKDKYIKNILNDNKLNRITNEKNFSEELEIPHVFASVYFDHYKLQIPNDSSRVFLFFDINLMKKYNPMHYCSLWNFSKFDREYCIKYNKNLSPSQNIKKWQKFTIKKNKGRHNEEAAKIYGPHTFVYGEIVFSKDIPLDKYLKCIYCYNAKWKHPLLITTRQKLKSVLSI